MSANLASASVGAMLKRWLTVPVMIVAALVSGCAVFATGKAATRLEEWGATQTDFPGAKVVRHEWKMGTTGAAVHHSVDSYAEARRFAEVVREAVARVKPPKSSRFVGRVDWPVAGGRTSFEFTAQGDVDEALWQVADADLPAAATTRRLGWMETKDNGRAGRSDPSLTVLEYDSTDLLRTAREADAPDGLRMVVREPDGGWLGPFVAVEVAPRAERVGAFGTDRLSLRGEHLVVTDATDLVRAATELGGHAWLLSAPGGLSLFVGPDQSPPLELVAWIVASGEDYSLRHTDRLLEIGASGRPEGCARFVAEAPDPGRDLKLSCAASGARFFLNGGLADVRAFHPVAVAAAEAGARMVSLSPGQVSVALDHERPSSWSEVTAALRTLQWEGEWEIGLQGRVASKMTFRSTADGEARAVDARKGNAEYKAEVEQLVAAWNASAPA